MAVRKNLRARLEALEVEYLRELRLRFDNQLIEGAARRIVWKVEEAYPALVKLDGQIVALRRKLREPIPGAAIEIAKRFSQRFGDLGTQQTFGAWIHLSKIALQEIDELEHISQ